MGLAMASKVNALLFYPWNPGGGADPHRDSRCPRAGADLAREPGHRRALDDRHLGGVLATAVAIFAFRVAQPYAFTGPGFWGMSINPYWKTDVFEGEWMRQKGRDRLPAVRAVRGAVANPLSAGEHAAVWARAGPGNRRVGIDGGGGAAHLPQAGPRVRAAGIAGGGDLGVQGIRFSDLSADLAPAYPLLCVMAGWGCANLLRWATQGGLTQLVLPAWPGGARRRSRARWLRVAAGGAFAVVVLSTAWWAIAFQNVYSSEHPRMSRPAAEYTKTSRRGRASRPS